MHCQSIAINTPGKEQRQIGAHNGERGYDYKYNVHDSITPTWQCLSLNSHLA